ALDVIAESTSQIVITTSAGAGASSAMIKIAGETATATSTVPASMAMLCGLPAVPVFDKSDAIGSSTDSSADTGLSSRNAAAPPRAVASQRRGDPPGDTVTAQI